MQNIFIKKIRLILWLILIIVVGFLLYQAIAPDGKVKYTYDFSKSDKINYFINKLTPKERIKIINNNIQAVVSEPVYFSLNTLRKFDKAKITLQYQNPDNLPLIEMGLLKGKTVWNYDLKPIVNKTLNQLILAWPAVYSANGEMLLEREKKYQTVDDFLKNPPPINEIAYYNYEFKNKFFLQNYKPTNQENKISQQLRGSYQFYTYIKNENLDFKFAFSSLNKNKNSDPIELNLYYQGKLINSQKLDDKRVSIDDEKKTDNGKLHLNIGNLLEGVYKVELLANDDIITDQIIFKQSKLSFINRLWLAEGVKNVELKTDSNIVNAQTINPASLQIIKVGDDNLMLNKTYQQFNIVSNKATSSIKLEKGDVILSGNGVFSFDQNSFIEPVARKVDNSLDVNANGINYVIANYKQPKEVGGWQVAEAEFDLTDAYREYFTHQLGATNKMSFLISAPGLNKENSPDSIYPPQERGRQEGEVNKIIIGKIIVELSGKSLIDKIKGIFYDKN
ncbi:MAG: hypothetical protein ABIE46_01600 [Patescibacteria group bacterium]